MKILVYFLISFLTFTITLGDICDHLGVTLYEDLGCIAHYGKSKSCPNKYTCKGLEPWNKYCHFRGNTYDKLQIVEDSLSSPSCDKACFCSSFKTKFQFMCAVLDCPEWLGVPTGPGCYRTYSLEQCCSVGEKCPPFTDVAKCTYDGIEYMDGQRFYPKNTCLDCICQNGFNGKLEEPFCRRRTCGEQLKRSQYLQSLCAPYYGKRSNGVFCCPEGWICSDGSEIIKGETKSDAVCIFGEKFLKGGQAFEKLNVKNNFGKNIRKVECECVVPPLVTCKEVD